MEPSISDYLNEKSNINTISHRIKIALVSSFSINGLKEVISLKCSKMNISSDIYEAPYNQVSQEIINQKSELYEFKPELTFLILDTRSILGEEYFFPYKISDLERKESINKKINQIKNLVKDFCEKSNSKLVITKLNIPKYSPYGIHETKTQFSFHQMIEEFNSEIVKEFLRSNQVYVYDFDRFVSKFGERNVFEYKQYYFGDFKISLKHLPDFGQELMQYVVAYLGISKKCIVLDLDNTLWGGIVGEDGFDGIRLGPETTGKAFMEFQKTLLALNQRGIILAINSKNNYDDAIKVIREHPYMILKEENFASIQINWDDKVTNMKRIAQEINIGLDSMVFMDDDPVNREFVKKSIPQILVIEMPKDSSEYITTIEDLIELNVEKITNEDKTRAEMYDRKRLASELEKSSLNMESFLKELESKITIEVANEFTLPRISQLTLKTNQFNLTTKRYQEKQIREMSSDQNHIIISAKVEDKFGDNGITGVVIIKKQDSQTWIIDTFLMSCRIMGRDIESGIFGYIVNRAKKENVKKILATYIPTSRNKPVEGLLSKMKFSKINDIWEFDVVENFKIPEYLEIN
jgi:FkbH-like protein